MCLKFLPILALVALAIGQDAGGGDLESVLQQIFGKPPAPGGGAPAQPAPTAAPTTQRPAPRPSTIVPGNTVTESVSDISALLQVDDHGVTEDLAADTSCTTEKNEVGECVRYYLCNVENNTVNTDGFGIIDIRVRDGPCESYLDTCCLLADKRPIDKPVTPKPIPEQKQRQGCGWRNPRGVDMQTVGDTEAEAKFGEFPWVVAILKIEPVNENQPTGPQLNVYVGGGSLIDPRVVLTTAHYVAGGKKLRIRAGEWDTQTTKEIHPYQDRDVESVAIHKDFNPGNLFYDVALLFLSTPVDPAPNIGVACLPPPSEKAQPDTRCFATGWGKDTFGKQGRYQVILKKVELPVVGHRPCRDLLRRTRLGRLFELHHTFMCAGGEKGKDTCKGDGGSPLVCPIEFQEDRYVQNGMVAWGIGCGEDGSPGVYVDVSVVRDWIDNEVLGKGITDLQYSKY